MFPADKTVGLCKYAPQPADALNVQSPAWDAPVDHYVCGWYTPTTLDNLEPFQGGHDRAQIDLCLIAPETFPAGYQDRLIVEGETYDVQGFAQDHTNGPWWNPGVVVWNLRRIVGG